MSLKEKPIQTRDDDHLSEEDLIKFQYNLDKDEVKLTPKTKTEQYPHEKEIDEKAVPVLNTRKQDDEFKSFLRDNKIHKRRSKRR